MLRPLPYSASHPCTPRNQVSACWATSCSMTCSTIRKAKCYQDWSYERSDSSGWKPVWTSPVQNRLLNMLRNGQAVLTLFIWSLSKFVNWEGARNRCISFNHPRVGGSSSHYFLLIHWEDDIRQQSPKFLASVSVLWKNFSKDWGWGSGWFKCIIFIMHYICFIITL